MVTTQIQLSEAQAQRLEARAAARGLSLERFLEDLVAQLDEPEPGALLDRYARAHPLIGSFADPDGRTDLSSNHDALAWEPSA
jgi:hypothetical protein